MPDSSSVAAPSINQKMARGIAWMAAARLTDRAIGVLSTLFLARLLAPDDFGLVAMATAVGAVLDLLSAFNFDLALIQNKQASRKHYDTVWTFNAIFGAAGGLALIALSVPAAHFYHEPRLTMVMIVLSFSYILGGFANVGVVNFRKELDFRVEFIFVFARRCITFFITLAAAFIFRSYWALLLGMTIGRLVGVGMSYAMNAYRPRFSLAAAGELFHFSKWMLINNGLLFLLHDGCTFIIGRVFGATELGIYSISYEISNLPSTELVAPINRVTFPGFAKMTEIDMIRSSYLRILGMIVLLVLPVGVGVASVAEPLVLTALGDQWTGAIPLIALLALNGAITATQTNNSSVWLAQGRVRLVTMSLAIFLAVLFPMLYWSLTTFGIVGAGYAYLSAQILAVPWGMTMTKRLLKFEWRDVARIAWRPVVAVTAMYIGVRMLDGLLATSLPLLRLLADIACGAVIYCTLIIVLWNVSLRQAGAEEYCYDVLKTQWRRRFVRVG